MTCVQCIREVRKKRYCVGFLLVRKSCRRSAKRILSVIRIERVHRVDDLGEIVFCLCLSGLVLNCFESGEEQADQNRDDRDDDQQLDESERAGVFWKGDAWGECLATAVR